MHSKTLQLAAALALCATTSAQIVVNEVLYDPIGADQGNELIEIANLGAASQDLTGWSLCMGFSTPNTLVYWNFPPGTMLGAGGFLTIHYFADGTNTATDIFTGTSPGGYTCGLPPLALDNVVGSVAIYSSTSCLGFPNPANIVDFMQWGGPNTVREMVAVAAGIWPVGGFIPAVAEGNVVAYDGSGDDPTDYFNDSSPTFGMPNTAPGSATVANYGNGCAGTNGVPAFATSGGPPALGNQSFALGVNNAIPTPGLLIIGVAQTNLPILGCNLLALPAVVAPATTNAPFPLPIPDNPSFIGISLFMQWWIPDGAGPQGLAASDGGQLTF